MLSLLACLRHVTAAAGAGMALLAMPEYPDCTRLCGALKIMPFANECHSHVTGYPATSMLSGQLQEDRSLQREAQVSKEPHEG
ncbi:hypothetical protein GDO86_014647 [Hymenochirus boettgeri]|uniref:Secreted protein n=1 Tax=Hymenochirus boettgeri TaxID=247094 RepID=A0A8T2JTN9_9PIPI|nr:hypothetical protein GDO86_014647 [Hymenochirus boettgeri]